MRCLLDKTVDYGRGMKARVQKNRIVNDMSKTGEGMKRKL